MVLKENPYILVTGGAGFVGSNLVRHLNRAGYEKILIVDDLTDSRKFKNLVGLKFVDYLDKDTFWKELPVDENQPTKNHKFDYVFHLGAISSTSHENGKELMEENYEKSRALIQYCWAGGTPMQYASSASVYGNSKGTAETPLNCYAFSKLTFDNYVRSLLRLLRPGLDLAPSIYGMRYFNVYGPGESHKDGQTSPVFSFFQKLIRGEKVEIFNRKAERDFIHVDDVCAFHVHMMELERIDNKPASQIIDVGTGVATSFRDVAKIVVKNTLLYGDSAADFGIINEKIRIKIFPENLEGKYQYFTKSNTNLKKFGFVKPLIKIEDGIASYIKQLMDDEFAKQGDFENELPE